MRLDRLIGILSILLQRDTVTAPWLAKRFEVSRRTINRDVEELCKAGIPVCTRQGQNGGISIMENFKLDRTLVTNRDMQAILAGLRSLDSVSGGNQYGQLMEKLQAGSSQYLSSGQSILIDLSSWSKDSLAPKLSALQTAIEAKRYATFDYYALGGETQRCIEPYCLVFRWGDWYVWGWCCEKEAFRLFKLARIEKLKLEDAQFSARSFPLPNASNEEIFTGGINVKALFSPDCKWKLIEEFGISSFCEQPDGRLLLQVEYTNRENLISWLLSFGGCAELLEPEEIRQEMLETANKLIHIYKEKQ